MRELKEGDVVVVCPGGGPPQRGVVVRCAEGGALVVRDEGGLHYRYFSVDMAGGRMASRGSTVYDTPEQYAAFVQLERLQSDVRAAARGCNDPLKLEAALAALGRAS